MVTKLLVILLAIFGVLLVILALQDVESGQWNTVAQGVSPLIVVLGVLAIVLVSAAAIIRGR